MDRPWEERQRHPADAEAVEGMGPISEHKGENLMPTDRGVAVYRRGLRRLIRDIQEGNPAPQPGQIAAKPVRTYGQDTVLKLPLRNAEADRSFMKRVGREVMEMQFGAEEMELDARDAHIIAKLQEMEAAGFQ